MKASIIALVGAVATASAWSNTTVPYTTSTITSTHTSTISECAATVTDCPYRTHPVTTVVVDVYTTYCPVSAAETASAPGLTSTAVAPPETTAAASGTVVPPPISLSTSVSSPSHTVVHHPSNTTIPFTGAASAQKAGGLLMAVGLVAAML